jgi:hypothetical protein
MSTEIIHLQIQIKISTIRIIRDFIGAIIKILYINKGMKQKAVQYFLIVFLALLVLGTILNIYKYKTLELMDEVIESFEESTSSSTSGSKPTPTTTYFDKVKMISNMIRSTESPSTELTNYLDKLLVSVEGNPECKDPGTCTFDNDNTYISGQPSGVFNKLYSITNTKLYPNNHFKKKEKKLDKLMKRYYKELNGNDYFSLENKETKDILNFEEIDNEFIIYANYGLLKYNPKKGKVEVVYSYKEGEKAVFFNINLDDNDIYSISPISDNTKVLHMKKDRDTYLIIGEPDTDTETWKFKHKYSTDNPC